MWQSTSRQPSAFVLPRSAARISKVVLAGAA
jgi:hypothetical protein